mmetsp:Transcript_26885/g.79234  ORF Transcript_26885/g.79234 Transcript_26885/m.79234 type:complete len:186 (-) Transcript_26885:256-813(-)
MGPDDAPSTADFFTTASRNHISKKSILHGSQNIHCAGRCVIQPGVVIHGEVAPVRIGRGCVIGSNTKLEPSVKVVQGTHIAIPMTIGDFVMIGEGADVQAASIGSRVQIGSGATLCPGVIVKDGVLIPDRALVPPECVIAPLMRASGRPASMLTMEPMHESTLLLFQEDAERYFEDFDAHFGELT